MLITCRWRICISTGDEEHIRYWRPDILSGLLGAQRQDSNNAWGFLETDGQRIRSWKCLSSDPCHNGQGINVFCIKFNLFWEQFGNWNGLFQEYSIRSAIRAVIPDVNLYMCHNHLIDQIKEWLGKHGGQVDDFGGILRQLSVLLNEEDETRWNYLYNKYRRQWSTPFLEYFQKHQLQDVKKSSRFITCTKPCLRV